MPYPATNRDYTRLIALYLPQFHPVPENDRWWGKGFTEWTNTARAKPLFRGHYQPHVPADLGFYDLRLPEARAAQAEMAQNYGVHGFCYYHYWFAGRRILERPFQEVLASGAPSFPFCLCWANETWSGIWHGAADKILIEQTYPGEADHREHFEALLPAFADPRHIRVSGKPLFLIYKPQQIPDVQQTMMLWRCMAEKAGLGGLHLVGLSSDPTWDPTRYGCDTKIHLPLILTRSWVSRRQPLRWLRNQYAIRRGWPSITSYAKLTADHAASSAIAGPHYPGLVHAWDNTPRSGGNGVLLSGTSPEAFRPVLRTALDRIAARPPEERLIFLKSWNEWTEGNHLEPDLRDEHGYLRVIQEEVTRV